MRCNMDLPVNGRPTAGRRRSRMVSMSAWQHEIPQHTVADDGLEKVTPPIVEVYKGRQKSGSIGQHATGSPDRLLHAPLRLQSHWKPKNIQLSCGNLYSGYVSTTG
ncbi:MAG: hypothetical protein ACQESR_12475 [Planctomycetota bacterium]